MESRSKVQVDNDRVRITRWDLPPGGRTGHHHHTRDYAVVPLTDGRLRLTGPGGASTARLGAGHAYFREAGVEHDVENAGDRAVAFVEIELKEPPS